MISLVVRKRLTWASMMIADNQCDDEKRAAVLMLACLLLFLRTVRRCKPVAHTRTGRVENGITCLLKHTPDFGVNRCFPGIEALHRTAVFNVIVNGDCCTKFLGLGMGLKFDATKTLTKWPRYFCRVSPSSLPGYSDIDIVLPKHFKLNVRYDCESSATDYKIDTRNGLNSPVIQTMVY